MVFRIGIFVFVMHNFYLLGAVCLGAASRILKSKIKETAAAVVVGVGLLVGSTVGVQAACNPPLRDVCFHKSGDWTTEGSVEMIVDFHVPSSKHGTTYRITESNGGVCMTMRILISGGFLLRFGEKLRKTTSCIFLRARTC